MMKTDLNNQYYRDKMILLKKKNATFYGRFFVALTIVFLLWPDLALTQNNYENGDSIFSDNTEHDQIELVIYQQAITSSFDENIYQKRDELIPGNHGLLTFKMHFWDRLDSTTISQWLRDRKISIDGVTLLTETIEARGDQHVRVRFEIKQESIPEPFVSEIRITGEEFPETVRTEVSFYPQKNHIIAVQLSDSEQTTSIDYFSGGLPLTNSVRQEKRPGLQLDLVPVVFDPGKSTDKKWYSAKKNWIVGASAIVLGNTAWMLLQTGENTTYLPEPPGRP